MKKVTVTIDTCCINVRQQRPALNKLEEWNNQSVVEIYRTDIMDEELKGRKRTKKAKRYSEDKGARIFDYTIVNHRIVGGEKPEVYPFHELIDIIFSNLDISDPNYDKKVRDVEHLSTHYQHRRDYFVTVDKHFIRKKRELNEKFGIVIVNPEECVEKIQHSLETRDRP